MTTGTVIVQDALAKRLILEPNVEPDEDQLAFGLRWLNRMMSQKSVQKANIFAITEEVFNLSDGVQDYSTSLLPLGRPVSVNYLFNRQSNVDYPCELVDNQTFADVQYKPVNAYPTICYYTNANPDALFQFYPRPSGVFECHVFVTRPLTGTITADTDVVLPEGFEAAIVDSLAVYYPFGVPATPDMKRDAKNGWDILTRSQYVPLISKTKLDRDYSVANDFPYSGF